MTAAPPPSRKQLLYVEILRLTLADMHARLASRWVRARCPVLALEADFIHNIGGRVLDRKFGGGDSYFVGCEWPSFMRKEAACDVDSYEMLQRLVDELIDLAPHDDHPVLRKLQDPATDTGWGKWNLDSPPEDYEPSPKQQALRRIVTECALYVRSAYGGRRWWRRFRDEIGLYSVEFAREVPGLILEPEFSAADTHYILTTGARLAARRPLRMPGFHYGLRALIDTAPVHERMHLLEACGLPLVTPS